MYTEIKLLIAGCTFVLSSAIMICASITVNGSGFDILSLFLGALGILFVIISLSLNKRDNTEVDNRKDPVSYTHLDVYKRQLLYRTIWSSRSYLSWK